jgi:hypothetical protein
MKRIITVSKLILVLSLILGTSSTALAATAVNLGTANSFAVLGGSTITNTGPTVVNGDLGLNPGTSLTGFPPGTVTGAKHITDATAAQAEIDLVTAYDAASGQTGAVTVTGDLGGRTLTPGVYNSASTMGLTGTLTLDGQSDPNAVFVFQVGSALTTASASNIVLTNGAQACNVYWQVSTSATIGTNSTFVGTVMALTSITATTGAVINGRVLARNGAVTLDTNSINVPTCTAVVITPTPIVTPTPVVTTPVVTPTPVVTTPVAVIAPVATPVPALPNTGAEPSSPIQLSTLVFTSLALVLAIGNRKQLFFAKQS